MEKDAPIDLHLLTGFLGSGKTTVLAELLRRPGGERFAVLVNEIGELALDHWLVEETDEAVMTLASGCVCCAIRGELYGAIQRVVALRPTRIIVETTGLADPAPILHGLAEDPALSSSVRPVSVVTVVDAERAEELAATCGEFLRQLEFADRIVLAKADLAPQRVAGVLKSLDELAPGCEVRVAELGRVDKAWLLAAPALARVTDAGAADRWLHHHAHEEAGGAVAHTVQIDKRADVDVLALWLRLVTQIDGPRLLRVKCLVEDRAGRGVFALQAAGRSVSPPRRLGAKVPGVPGVRAVLIERDLGAVALAQLFASLYAAVDGRLA